MYPARNPMIVLERPATPNTPKENVSWRRPQTVPRQAPNISPLVMAKYMTTRLKKLNNWIREIEIFLRAVYNKKAKIIPTKTSIYFFIQTVPQNISYGSIIRTTT